MKNTISIGRAGEYYTAAKLELLGFTTALPASGTDDYDLLIINRETKKQFAIQVKTTTGKQNEWKLSKKNEEIKGERIVYIFVHLYNDEINYHIVDSKTVANHIYDEHQTWLNTPGKRVEHHKENDMRVFRDVENKYLNNWEILNE